MCTDRLVLMAMLALAAGGAVAEPRHTAGGPVEVAPVAVGLDTPWSVAFLPSGGFLVTERPGRLRHFAASGESVEVAGVPEVVAKGQGGLLDVLVPRDFAASREVFLSYASAQGGGAGTAVGVGRLSPDGARLEGFHTIFEMTPGSSGGRHFGSRIVEGRDGALYVTVGERGDRPSAQDLGRHNGSVLRIARDGSAAPGNPFAANPGAQPEIWSYGHRNPQGAALDAQGALWVVEHGARGGDEVNRIVPGANYGWPVISYGRHYSGAKIGEGTGKTGMEQPAFYWDPSIAPSGLVIYEGEMFPEWRGDFLVGSLKFGLISRLERSADGFREVERIEWPETARTRDLRQAPDGSLWIVSEDNGAIYRVTPRAAE
ncbi:PQQ-dependent sugar dehydrogenase [Tropicimonas sp.]|uniref:PQQ-dependent sugar dehydrogenase n=1 Tax=Tropicimonas sp. TaxID=2067044 RepID=UPI003A8C6D4F